MSTQVKMLMRAFSSSQMGIFSELHCGDMTLFTLEPPWDTGNRFDQCIPAGVYDVARIPNENAADKWLVLDVDGHTAIQILPGNVRTDTSGNILLGAQLGCIDDTWAIRESNQAFDFFERALIGVDTFRLYIDRSIINQDLNQNVR